MCGRYTLSTRDGGLLDDRFGGGIPPAVALGRWNVAPTEAIAVVTRAGTCEQARWGLLPPWAKDLEVRPQPFNVRSEQAAGNRIAGRAEPCLVLADGWYEWLRAEHPKLKPAPLRYTVDGGAPFAFAGLTTTHRIGGERVRSAAILTCPPNALCARVHDRMPVVLAGPAEERAWLASPRVEPALCVPLEAARCSVQPVSARVNKAGTGDEGPHLLEPDEPDLQPEPTLF